MENCYKKLGRGNKIINRKQIILNTKDTIRITELDALRGIAAISVVLFHYTAKYREFFGYTFSSKYDFKYGHFGVELFFIISGFVIWMTITKSKNTFDFIYKRFSRLYPTFWVSVFITALVLSFGTIPKLQTSMRDTLLNLTMFYRSIGGIKDVDGAYWSLQPELQFYLLIVLIFYLKKLDKIKLIGIIWMGLTIVENYYFHFRGLGRFINLQFSGLFFAGIIFYKIMINKENTLTNHLLIALTFIVNVFIIKLTFDLTITIIALLVIYFVFYLFIFQRLKWLNNKFLLYLGTISYALYLVHQNIGYVIIKYFQNMGYEGGIIIIFTIFIAILLASLITFYIEKPSIKFLRK